ncbi:hypothetical protein ACLKA6_010129 [Drosophila palustris]
MVLPRVAAMFSDLVCAMPVALSYLESELGCVEDDIPRFRVATQTSCRYDDRYRTRCLSETAYYEVSSLFAASLLEGRAIRYPRPATRLVASAEPPLNHLTSSLEQEIST